MTLIETEVLAIINTTTDSIYNSTLHVVVDDDSYTLKLDISQYLSPMTLSYQGTKEGFLLFVEKEFKSRRLEAVSYFKGERTEDANFNGLL